MEAVVERDLSSFQPPYIIVKKEDFYLLELWNAEGQCWESSEHPSFELSLDAINLVAKLNQKLALTL